MNAQAESHTRLHGRWLIIARLAWVIIFLTLTTMYALGFLAVRETLSTICDAEPCSLRVQIRRTDAGEQIMRSAGPPVGYADRLSSDQVEALETLDLTLDQYGWLGALQLGLPTLVLLLIAAGLFWWRSDDWMALFASIMVATFPIHNMPLVFTLEVHQPAWEWVGNLVSVVALSCLLIFPLIFPTGQFVPPWTRWMAIYDVIGAVIASFLGSAILDVFGEDLGRVFIGLIVVLPFGIGVYAQLYRYFRVARPDERQQFKWVVVGLVAVLLIQFAVLIPLNALLTSPAFSADPARALVLSAIPDTLWQLNNLLIAVCIVISVLRYRLWDVDILINRAIVYSTLTAVIAGLYILVVGSLSSLMQNRNDVAATAVALLIVVALFQPLRRALQNSVNRLLRFDPARRDESESWQRSSEQPDKAQEEHTKIQGITEVDSSPHTRLQGRWLFSARLVWVAIAILAAIIHIAAAPVAFDLLRTPCYQKPCETPFQTPSEEASTLEEQASLKRAWHHTITEATVHLLLLGVALFIFWRLSDDWMAHLTSIMLVTVFAVFSPSPILLANDQPLWYWPRALVWAIGLASTVGLFYLFPDGRFVPRWTRGLAVVLLVIIGALAAAGAPFLSGFPIFVVALVTGAGFQIYRYRRVSGPFQRQQTKWVVLGIIGMVLPMLVFFLIAFLNPSLNPLLDPDPLSPQDEDIFSVMLTLCVVIPLCFLPVTLAFSLLRYRLWDVDILINRTLVYGALTASVVALYVLIVGWSSIGLQTQNNLAGSVFAVLVIALLFRPLRQRLQRIADRLAPVPESTSPSEQTEDKITILKGDSTVDSTWRGQQLLLARVVWILIALLSISIFILGTVAQYDRIRRPCSEVPLEDQANCRPTENALHQLGLTWDDLAMFYTPIATVAVLPIILIGFVVFWRKSETTIGLLFSLALVTGGSVSANQDLIVDLFHAFPNLRVPITFVHFLSNTAPGMFLCLFPDGRFVPRWTRGLLILWAADVLAVSVSNFLVPSFRDSLWRQLLDPPGMILLIVAGIYALIFRYRHDAGPLQREQIKWIIVAGVIVNIFMIGFKVLGLFWQPGFFDLFVIMVYSPLWYLGALFAGICIGISIFRYRLWDVDVLINRTLVYGALTGMVVSAFVLLVGFLSILFQSSGNSIIAIVATGLIALLFNPLRQRLQRAINHLMYGERDDPYVALSRLGRRLETSIAPESVLPTVVTTVRDVLRLPYVAIYLQQDSHGYKIVAESASPSLRIENGRIRVPGMEREGRCIPLIHQGERVGYIVLGPRAPNEAFSSTDLHLLDDLAPQVGVAVHAVRLTADLQRSREQLVLAREEERRRLRRDLHDDLAPTLASLGLTASTAADLISTNPTTATKLVRELQTEIRATVGNIRRLVYDLRPPTLDELGLLAAVRERAAQYTNAPGGVHITVDAPPELPVLAAAVEVAAYRIVQEALENVSKHSHAQQCAIRFTNHNGLEIEIMDDGIGLPPNTTPGVGLRSMRERAEELGGSCVIEPCVNGGTRILARLPIGDSHGSVTRIDRG